MKTQYPANWPQGLIDIAEILSPELALVMAEHIGGVPYYVPKEPETGHKLAKIIGLPALRMLAAVYGGECVTVPKYAAGKSKKVKIRQLLKEGSSVRETALQADATVRWVTEVSREMREDARQLSLFDI